MSDLDYLLTLHSIDGLGTVRLKKMLSKFGSFQSAWEANSKEFLGLSIPKPIIDQIIEARKRLDPQNYTENIFKKGIKVVTLLDKNYPKRLSHIYDPPIILYYKGEILESDDRAIGIVGTRKVTGYGKIVTEKFSSELSQAGFTIVSGLARGVDTIAHKSALESSGRTLAILGGGLNKIFPPDNTQLAQKITSGFGAVISEFPPDYPSLAGNFPARNRIIAGLSIAVLVTEAAEDSGSLITARMAIDEGREVFAIPGPITSTLSKGPSELIKSGAKLVTSSEDILDELGLQKIQSSKQKVMSDNLSELEKKILKCLESESKHIDQLCRDLKKTSSEISALLLKMEIMGFVKNEGAGVYIRV